MQAGEERLHGVDIRIDAENAGRKVVTKIGDLG
jgi:hypothetical protein